jgi:peptide/nickel transport system substrate-binding protein
MRKSIRKTLGLGLMTLQFFCGAAYAGKANDTLVVADREEVVNFDQYYGTARIEIIIGHHIFDRLIHRDPDTNEFKPMLATAWRWVDDRTLEFKLRQGVTFHDGETFDADDVVYTFKRALDPASQIKAVNNTRWIEDVEKVDNSTVRIRAKYPFPSALHYLAGPLPIYGKDYYEKVGPEGMRRKPIGSGPYRVEKVEPGTAIHFVRNDNYWAGAPRGPAAIKNIILRTIPDQNTQIAELMTGGVDWIWKVTKDQAASLEQARNLSVVRAETMRVGYLTMDAAGLSGANPMQQKAVRQAIAHGVNREALRRGLMSDGGTVLNAICFPRQFGCSQDVRTYEYDPAKAKALLAEAGVPNGFRVRLNAFQDRDLAEGIIGDLRKIGINADLNFGQYTAIRDLIRSGKSTISFMTHGSFSINDVSALIPDLFAFTPDDIHRDPQVRDWLKVADGSLDENVRKENYLKALRRIADEAYVVPLWTYPIAYAFSNALDFKPSTDEIPRFDAARWK